MLPPDTLRAMLRLDETEEVRCMLDAGDEEPSSSSMLRRCEGGSGRDLGARMELEERASSVLEELALEFARLASRAPYREGGGGGGDFALDIGSWLIDVGVCGGSTECCEDMVRFELLRCRLSRDVDFSWLCLRASGTGGGAFFGLACSLDGLGTSSSRNDNGRDWGGVKSGEAPCVGGCCWWALGVGGSGLYASELSVRLMPGVGAGSVASKSSNETTCGCLGATGLPWRGFGAGGGFFLPFFASTASPMCSSSSSPAVSSEVRDESASVSWGSSDIDCRDMDEASVLLLLSNCALLAECGALPGCADGPEARGVGRPVMSRFLKLSTSRDARLVLLLLLLLPAASRCACARSSGPASLSCGSNDASVFAKGFAGMLRGEGAPNEARVAGRASAMAMASLPMTCALASPAVSGWVAKAAGVTGGGGLAGGGWLARRAWSSLRVALASSKSGWGGGMVVVGDTMRTDFLVRGGGVAASSSTVRQLLLQCQQKQTQQGRGNNTMVAVAPASLGHAHVGRHVDKGSVRAGRGLGKRLRGAKGVPGRHAGGLKTMHYSMYMGKKDS